VSGRRPAATGVGRTNECPIGFSGHAGTGRAGPKNRGFVRGNSKLTKRPGSLGPARGGWHAGSPARLEAAPNAADFTQ